MNQSIITSLLTSLLITISAYSPLVVAQNNSKVLYVNDSDWPPYFFKGAHRKLPGLGKELLSHCAKQSGYELDYTYYPLKRMRKYIEDGYIDTNIYSHKKEREQFLLYGHEPWFESSYRPVVLRGSKIEISSLSSFNQLSVGHMAGLRYSQTYYDYIQKRESTGNLVVADSTEALFELLIKGRIDVFVNTKESVTWQAKEKGVFDKIEILDFDVKTSQYYFTVSKKSARISDKTTLIDDMDACIKQMKTDGSYHQIAIKYGVNDGYVASNPLATK